MSQTVDDLVPQTAATLRSWASWIYLQAELAHRTAGPGALDPDGQPATWLTYCGMFERMLLEAAMAEGVWREPT